MDLPASWHAEDALTGLAAGTLALLALVLLARRGRLDPTDRTAGALVAAGAAPVVALVLTLGADRLTDVTAAGIAAGAAVAAVGGAGAHRLHHLWGAPVAAGVLVTTAAGIWAAVPDTEAAVVVLAAWVPLAAATVLVRTARVERDPPVPRWWSVALWWAVALVAAFGAVWGAGAREQALPGGLACFGITLVVPLLASSRGAGAAPAMLLAVHAAAVVAAARWAARAETVGGGLIRALAVLVVLGAAVAVSGRRAGPARPPPSRPQARPR